MARRLLNALGTVNEMLVSRGGAASEAIAAVDLEAAENMVRAGFHQFDLPDRKVFVFTSKLKSQEVTKAVEATPEAERARAIVIVAHRMTAAHIKLMRTVFDPSAEIFEMEKLVVNPSQYHLVPEHAIVAKEDVAGVLKRLSVDDVAKLPRILASDIMAKYIGAREGDVVKITRKSPSYGTSTCYRICTRVET